MLEIKKHFDLTSMIVIAITFILFVSAVFTRGFTHDLLLEAAIFLVSVKLIVMAYKNIDATDSLHKKLDEMAETLDSIASNQSRESSDS